MSTRCVILMEKTLPLWIADRHSWKAIKFNLLILEKKTDLPIVLAAGHQVAQGPNV